ncbi:MAG TPA: transcriptional repressor NrdR [Synergistetes bacterium]|nr:transcriptional repressor NrdR [Synergistota bacterium]
MRCPKCGYMETRVLETRTASEGKVIRRRRECPECLNRFTTYERLDERPVLWIIKKNGQREAFDRAKLLKGLARACEKLPVQLEQIEDAASRIEEALRRTGQGEISSLQVGSLAMNELRGIHKVAYVRFASVYREFTDISSFVEEISRLHEERNGHL